jgi:hypothetical protein
MRNLFIKSARVLLVGVGAAACSLLSGSARASCEDLSNQTVYVGVMSARVGAAGDLKLYVNAFNGGNHHELDVGANHTIGFLAPGQSFILAVGTATAQIDHSGRCYTAFLNATFSWYLDNNTCSGTPAGTDVRAIAMDTCNGPILWRGQKSLFFPGIGNAASYRISLNVNVPRSTKEVQEDGCFRVASVQGPNACND